MKKKKKKRIDCSLHYYYNKNRNFELKATLIIAAIVFLAILIYAVIALNL